MKKILLILVAAFVVTGVSAKLDPDLKKAFKYRSDISKEALAKIKKWPDKTGIIHGDWIENRNGRSIDLQGNELFPYYDYTQLEQGYDSLLVMTMADDGKRGVITSSGRSIIPFEYDAIDFSLMTHGLILARNYKEKLSDGKEYDLTHVFSKTGKNIDCIMDLGHIRIEYMPRFSSKNRTSYDYMALTSTYNKDESTTYTNLFYLNGDKAADCVYGAHRIKKITPDSVYTAYTSSGDILTRVLSSHNASHPDIFQVLSTTDEMKIDREYRRNAYLGDYWVNKGLEYYNNKEYEKAAFCFNYYGKFGNADAVIGNIASVPCYLFFLSLLSSCYNAGDYKTVMNTVRQHGFFTSDYRAGVGNRSFYFIPYGLELDVYKDVLSKNSTGIADLNVVEETDREIANTALDNIVAIYNSSVTAYQQKQQANAAIFGAVLGAVAGTVSNIAGGNSGTSTTPSYVSGSALTGGTSTSSTTSSSSSSSNSSSSQTQTKKRCNRCKGSGQCIRCNGSGKETTFSGKSTTVCGMCHGKGSCLSCNGTGYYQY